MSDGCDVHVESAGQGDPPIVLLHGLMMSSAVFKHQVPVLSLRQRVVTIDLRGFGQSEKPEIGYSLETYISDLRHLIDFLELDRPIIAGWSLGGIVALAFAAAFPRIASALVLIGTTPCLIQRPDWPDAVAPDVAAQFRQMLSSDYNAGVEAFCRLMFPEPNSDDQRDFVRDIMLGTPPHVTLACLRNISDTDLRPLLESVREPASIICGTEDVTCPPAASRFMAARLRGQLTLIPDAGHCVFLTRPQVFNDALLLAISNKNVRAGGASSQMAFPQRRKS